MRILLFLIAVLAFLAGLATFGGAKSAVHEIEGLVAILTSMVCLAGAGIIEAVNRLREVIERSVASAAAEEVPV